MDSILEACAFRKQMGDFLTSLPPPTTTSKLSISYAFITVGEIGLYSWVALSGLSRGIEPAIRESLVSIVNDTWAIFPCAPTGDEINALLKVINHAAVVAARGRITQFARKKEKEAATHKQLEKKPRQGYPNNLLCSDTSEGDIIRGGFFEKSRGGRKCINWAENT